jgi:hypothetical protein
MGARKYPVTSVCQPDGSAAGFTSTGRKGGGVRLLVGGGCARGGSSAGGSGAGSGLSSAGGGDASWAAAETDNRDRPRAREICSLRSIGVGSFVRPNLFSVSSGYDVGL